MPDPRRAALILLNGVMVEGRTLADLTGRTGPLTRMEPGDRARAQRLATETMRYLGPIDSLLLPHVAHTPPDAVLNVMRIAAYELCIGEAAHGVVNTAVTQIAAMPRHNRAKGMANAVLRRVAEAPVDLSTLPPSKLPEWLRDPLIMAWGEDTIAACETAHAKGAPIDLTLKDPATADQLAEALPATRLPTGSLRITGNVQVSALPGFAEGQWWVQDVAAAIPVQMLDPQKSEKILDLCAAPGGKTLQLAAAGARVTALDISNARIERVAENLKRTGLDARTVTADALEFRETGWDAILLDAPCSATGTIRRHPDLPYANDGSAISDLIDLQAQMIDHAISLLKPGGRLVFCTCSLIPDEGEVQVDEALARHPGLSVDRSATDRPGLSPDWVTEEGGLRLRPDFWADEGGMDGFYCAVLRKG
ncbi:RsmB/NOP family class I SAM-dependent RNA methyltransferase [Pseudooceanicola onchidii]|uniref:RsmB/NOP family class I SAM-dependent RNA methyltransferase n=1 Tax=Pseudooceanicola onchidii TaxID=2562279 RepID=UPI0023EF52CB|nr:RsmB/NOP family class I SAM-dependent RNA methyltransferase [Pseudooceanicola onchidii]